MKTHHCEFGVAFDGDADRCLAVDENGTPIDGDQLIAIFAADLKEQGKLAEDTIVLTVMSNIGMRRFAKENGLNLVTTSVGDRYILEEMVKNHYNLGGEDSGHIILKDFANTGDGQLSAVQLLQIYKKRRLPMSELSCTMKKAPQVLQSVSAGAEAKSSYQQDPEIIAVIRRVEESLGDTGRVLVRASGTEPLIRVMIEGNDLEEITAFCNQICEVIKERTS